MATQPIADHILGLLSTAQSKPLIVGVQGPQGSGKSFESAQVKAYLELPPHSLHVVVLSIDDLYLPHSKLVELAQNHPDNRLWKGRGQPGTHDLPLALDVLSRLRSGNGTIELPRFDKSLHSGEGDRLPMNGSGTVVTQPPVVDVVILEGWCVGFQPISPEELRRVWETSWADEREKLGLGFEQVARIEDLEAVNTKLREYLELWALFDAFVQLRPIPPVSKAVSEYAVVYKWRLEQEDYMKSMNGGRGMTTEQVKTFVDRYIPGYVFFGQSIGRLGDADKQNPPPRWHRKGLELFLDADRNVVRVDHF